MNANRAARAGRDALLTLAIFACAVAVCAALSRCFDDNNPFAAPVFILAVALVARFTDGYVCGVLASAAGVFCVNYMFTYPFWEFDMSIAGYPLTFAAMLLVSLIISTLTTRIKRQEQLRFEAETEKLRADLLRSVSHDLRTPLTSILGASSTLMENGALEDGDRDELLRAINKDARWLVRVTENILSVTRFSGGVELKKEPEVVEEVVGSAIVKFRKSRDALPVSVVRPEQILVVPMDATLIEQVLINLFENAALHAQTATRICVRIACERDRVTFAVEDDGAGISPQLMGRLFEHRIAGERLHADQRRSMGIGLSVCRSILRAHGGDICCQPREGGGAAFLFWLPYKEEKNAR